MILTSCEKDVAVIRTEITRLEIYTKLQCLFLEFCTACFSHKFFRKYLAPILGRELQMQCRTSVAVARRNKFHDITFLRLESHDYSDHSFFGRASWLCILFMHFRTEKVARFIHGLKIIGVSLLAQQSY